MSYGTGTLAPGRCSPGQKCAIPTANSLTEPYIVGHNLLRAHAEAVDLYNKYYKVPIYIFKDSHIHSSKLIGSGTIYTPILITKLQGENGRIGLVFDVMGYLPYENTFLDQHAQERSMDLNLGWFVEPVVRGDYPFSMRSLARERLPFFNDKEQEKLVGSYDMMGINYYTSKFSKHIDISPNYSPVFNTDDAYATKESKEQ